MTYKLLALDLDDTLLGPDRRVGDRAKEVVRLAQDRGAVVVLATGRPYSSARLFAGRLGISGPVIGNGGAVVRDGEGRKLRELFLDGELCAEVVGGADRCGAIVYAYNSCRVWTNRPHPATDRYAQILDVPIEVDEAFRRSIVRGDAGVNALALRVDDSCAAEVEGELRRRLGDRALVIHPLSTLIEILPPGGAKGDALDVVCSHLGLALSSCVAVGDSRGDIDMLRAAGLGVLVANAHPDLHPEADLVTTGPFVEGVLEVVERFFPGREI
ncbi:MAG: HAD family hydrolase [Bacillota bacterium]